MSSEQIDLNFNLASVRDGSKGYRSQHLHCLSSDESFEAAAVRGKVVDAIRGTVCKGCDLHLENGGTCNPQGQDFRHIPSQIIISNGNYNMGTLSWKPIPDGCPLNTRVFRYVPNDPNQSRLLTPEEQAALPLTQQAPLAPTEPTT